MVQCRLRDGGPDQDRTDDLRNAIAALFQLSYEPIRICEVRKNRPFAREGKEFLGAPWHPRRNGRLLVDYRPLADGSCL